MSQELRLGSTGCVLWVRWPESRRSFTVGVGLRVTCVGTCPFRLRCLGGELIREDEGNMQRALGASWTSFGLNLQAFSNPESFRTER